MSVPVTYEVHSQIKDENEISIQNVLDSLHLHAIEVPVEILEGKGGRLAQIAESMNPLTRYDKVEYLKSKIGDGRSHSKYRMALVDVDDSNTPSVVVYPKSHTLTDIHNALMKSGDDLGWIHPADCTWKPATETPLSLDEYNNLTQLSKRLIIISGDEVSVDGM